MRIHLELLIQSFGSLSCCVHAGLTRSELLAAVIKYS